MDFIPPNLLKDVSRLKNVSKKSVPNLSKGKEPLATSSKDIWKPKIKDSRLKPETSKLKEEILDARPSMLNKEDRKLDTRSSVLDDRKLDSRVSIRPEEKKQDTGSSFNSEEKRLESRMSNVKERYSEISINPAYQSDYLQNPKISDLRESYSKPNSKPDSNGKGKHTSQKHSKPDDSDVKRVLQSPTKKAVFEDIALQKEDVHEPTSPKLEKIEQKSVERAVTPHDDLHSKAITTRKEVAHLRNTMRNLIEKIGANEDSPYPTEMDLFMKIIVEEQKIYDTVFQELIRQVTVNMIERGEVLAEIRKRYSNMFMKIPNHILNLHTELIANRKLNRRLTEELVRAKDHIGELLKELDFVREHDALVNSEASQAQEKLMAMLNNAESAEESMEEFHKLYRMQRTRLETQLKIAEKEKRLWVDAATNLALRIGQEYGISDLLLLLRYEDARLRVTNHMVVNISDFNGSELRAIEHKIDEWRGKLLNISKQIVDEDFNDVEILSKIQRMIKKVQKNLVANVPLNEVEEDHKLLNGLHVMDANFLTEQLQEWATLLMFVTSRFTSGKDVSIREEITQVRKISNQWTEACFHLIKRNQSSSNGNEYHHMNTTLTYLQTDIYDWLTKLESRASGEDGIANAVIVLQNQIEDKLKLQLSKTTKLSPQERTQTIDLLATWVEQIGVLISILSNTAEREQHKIPLQVEGLITKILEQMNNESDTKTEDNIKLHTSLVSFMVNVLLPKPNQEDAVEQMFHVLNKDLNAFNTALIKDSGDIVMISDDKRDLRKMLNELSESWVFVGKRLLDSQLNYSKNQAKKEQAAKEAQVK
ncbi:Axonemal dynein light chain domain-containing protein 1 [Boothiomyces sp. JEL0866]|nr:Axonemal dynein light chain domain-containing protein 1 [Boothiomyces sp. JEL0866]